MRPLCDLAGELQFVVDVEEKLYFGHCEFINLRPMRIRPKGTLSPAGKGGVRVVLDTRPFKQEMRQQWHRSPGGTLVRAGFPCGSSDIHVCPFV